MRSGKKREVDELREQVRWLMGIPQTRKIDITDRVAVGGDLPPLFIAGPCVIESEEHALRMGSLLKETSERLGINLLFKASFDKANRMSLTSYRGPGLKEGLRILERVKKETGLPVLSDVHETAQVAQAARVLDVVQIPAFLCRQTDLIVEAARSGKVINIKKGQFLSPRDMVYILEKATGSGASRMMITERGFAFGYRNLVVDFRAFPLLRKTGYPVVFDVTHSLQIPGGEKGSSGGEPEFVLPMARAAAAAGVDAFFFEVHDDPERALSDASSMIRPSELENLIPRLMEIHEAIRR